MAKLPKYRLQALFDIREKAKEEAEKVYAAKMAEVARQKKLHDEMKQKLRDMIANREAKKNEYVEKMRTGELNITQITGNDRHIDRLKQEEAAYQVEISRQLENVRDAENEAEEAKQEMLKANQDYKALEKHKEKWVKGVRREVALKEEGEAEDIAQAQYFSKMVEDREEQD